LRAAAVEFEVEAEALAVGAGAFLRGHVKESTAANDPTASEASSTPRRFGDMRGGRLVVITSRPM